MTARRALGVLGGGQLGAMFAEAGLARGFAVHMYSPNPPAGAPAGTRVTRGEWSDLDRLSAFAREVEAVTLEFENIPEDALRAVAELRPLWPSVDVVVTSQHRIREKSRLAALGLPVTPFLPVDGLEQGETALATLGVPCVLKTTMLGYDGHGQRVLQQASDLTKALGQLGPRNLIAEQWVDFAQEYSVIMARGGDGSIVSLGPMENHHRHHRLDLTVVPCDLDTRAAAEAVELARQAAIGLDVRGLLTVEFFRTRDDRWLINELAPRPHNSGHWSIEGATLSQFDLQVMTMAGLALAPATWTSPAAAMVNLYGDLWVEGRPPKVERLAGQSNVFVHIYGKDEPRPGRKMGHITVLGPSRSAVAASALNAREEILR